MDKYIYLLLSLFLLAIWALIFFLRQDLRKKMLTVSFLGGLAGIISEFWYFKDYWRPPSILGQATISIEDFLFGFTIMGIAATLYDVFFNRRIAANQVPRKKFTLLFFFIGLSSLLIFNGFLNINSIFVSSLSFLLISLMMVNYRKDLLAPSLASGVLTVLMASLVYIVVFNWLFPGFWGKVWLLSNTKFGVMILGEIPLTELLWYFSWGCLSGIGYEFTFGYQKVPRALAKKSFLS